MPAVDTPDKYAALFSYTPEVPDTKEVSERKEAALKEALDVRKFEIELYWKRATYFWTLIAASFGGYFALEEKGVRPNIMLTVACLGTLLSLAWYLVNRGSKFWQENWERHVALLERGHQGALHATVLNSAEFPFRHLFDAYRYSVTRVNTLVSFFVFVTWVGLAVRSSLPSSVAVSDGCITAALITGTVIALAFLVMSGQSGDHSAPPRVAFTTRWDPPNKR